MFDFTLCERRVNVVTSVDVHIEAAKEYIDLNCNIHTKHQHQYRHKQESIPVGCVPPTFVVCGGKGYPLIPTPPSIPYPLNTSQIPRPKYSPPERDMGPENPYPPVNRLIDTYEDTTFHQLLFRTVKIKWVLDQFKSVIASANADDGCEHSFRVI